MKFDHLEHIELVDPGPTAVAVMERHLHKRTMPLHALEKGPGDTCVWCNVNPIVYPKRRWCSSACIDSAGIFAHPHKPSSKAWVLIYRQNCACTVCGVSYEELVRSRIKKRLECPYRKPTDEVSLHSVGDGTGHLMHVDHRVPLHKGGAGFGIENIQVICVKCHAAKTAEERDPSVFSLVDTEPSDWVDG